MKNIVGEKNPTNNEGVTPLHLASENGHLELVQFLLEQIEGEKNPKDVQGRRPTDIAHNEEIRKLIESFIPR